MIENFSCKETYKIWTGYLSRKFPPDIQNVARRKLRYLNNAADINDLRIPPANRLEKLSGGRRGTYSIRVNNRWRICFTFKDGDAREVEIIDYH